MGSVSAVGPVCSVDPVVQYGIIFLMVVIVLLLTDITVKLSKVIKGRQKNGYDDDDGPGTRLIVPIRIPEESDRQGHGGARVLQMPGTKRIRAEVPDEVVIVTPVEIGPKHKTDEYGHGV